ncbi:MAG TPA: PQQ-binding-like beta-propeller repeat protein [Paracoccaceae bacterium]|nr:PQQ-binding-like beta-propeller repeat protein [Paracoccaceae bacterium]
MRQAIRLALVLAIAGPFAACGMFDEEERLSGERIHIRDQVGRADAGQTGQAEPLPDAVLNQDWTQTNGRATHASGHLAGPAAPTLAWRADIGAGGGSDARITGAPIVSGARVYALDAEARLGAFDAGSGAPVWRTSLAPAGEPGSDGFGGGLATDGRFVYATTGFGEILAIDAASGEIAWRHREGAPFRAAPAVSGGVVVAVTRGNRAVAVSAATGEVLWRIEGMSSDAGLLGGASPALSGDLAVLPFASGEVVGVQLSTGRTVWSAVLGGARRGLARSAIADITGDPVIAGRAVVAANQAGRTVAVDGQTGARGWTRSIGAIGPIWAARASIFMVTDDKALTRLSLQDGRTIWRTELPAFGDPEDRQDPIAYSGPVLVGGQLLVTDSTGNMLSFDPATGQPGPVTRLSAGSITGPVVANGTIYVLSGDGTLQAFR